MADSSKPLRSTQNTNQWIGIESKLIGMPRKIYGVRGTWKEIDSPLGNSGIEFNDALEK